MRGAKTLQGPIPISVFSMALKTFTRSKRNIVKEYGILYIADFFP